MWIPFSRRPSFAVTHRPKQEAVQMNGNLLQKPVTTRVNTFNTVLNNLEVGHSSMQGYRITMEDACVAVLMDDLPDHVIVGIMDGHVTGGASEYISRRLPQVIAETSHYKEYVKLKESERAASVNLLSVALVQAFIDIDEEYFNYEEMDNSGSTAVCALITPTHILCASVGDSRCVVGTSNSEAISLSEDHKPQLKDEKLRIEAAGGYVFMDRVNGELAMSRALGDYQYKQNDKLDRDKQVVSCYPDVAIHVRSSKDQLLVLACDGVWDVMTNAESISFLQDIVREEDGSMSSYGMADALIELAFAAKSTDNISALVVKLSGNEADKATDDDVKKHKVSDKKRKIAE